MNTLPDGICYVPGVVRDHGVIYDTLVRDVSWDDRMRSRRTASFGVPYDYSGVAYEPCEMPAEVQDIASIVTEHVGFEPNNCLANYYPYGTSTMGFHADSIESLESGTGIAVVSLGVPRDLSFRRSDRRHIEFSIALEPGSLLLMSASVQSIWLHGLCKTETQGGRISLTFRRLKA